MSGLADKESGPLGALDQAPCGFVRFGDNGVVLQTNATLCKMLGYAPGEIDGREIGSILSNAARVFYQTHFFPLLRLQGRAEEIYLSLVDRNGQSIPVLVNAVRKAGESLAVNDCIVVRMKQRSHCEDALLEATRLSERVAAELRESQYFLQRVADVTPGVIHVFDLQKQCTVFVNRTAGLMPGYSPQAITSIGTDVVSSLMHPDDMPRYDAHMRGVRLLDDDSTADFECRMHNPAGGWCWLHSRFAVFSRNDAGVCEIVSMSIDITARKAAEEDLRASEAQFRVLTTAMPQLVWSCSSAGECIFQAPQWCTVTGQSVAESLGIGWADMVHPDDQARCTAEWQQAVAQGAGYRAEYRLRTRDQGYRWFLARAEALRDAQGGLLRWIGTSTDIDDAKRLELQRHESEARMRLATEATGVGIWEWNVLSGEIRWDAQMFRIYGWPPTGDGVVAYADWCQAVLADDLPRQSQFLQDVLNRLDKGGRNFRIRRQDDGQYRDIHAAETVRLDAAGQAEWVIGTNLDITNRVRMEQALNDAGRRKDEFLATLAHELRNPLAPISNSLELLRLAGANAGVIDRARTVMQRQVAKIVRLVDDLLDVSRFTHDKLNLKKEHVDLTTVVQAAIDACRPHFDRARQDLEVSLPERAIDVHADQIRLLQVFGNLLINASKYTAQEGRIWLTVEQEGHDAVVTVTDTGIGIPADMRSQVFELFTQVKDPLVRSQGGLGVGLSLARRLVEQHGGTLVALSEGPGHGSQFVVHLPVHTAQPPAEPASPAQVDRIDTISRRVLVVDDNRDSADSLVDMLSMSGHETRKASDGPQAINSATVFRPDAIVLDIGLPGLSGYDVCRHIRAQPWGKNIVMIALTGWGQLDDRRRSVEAGFDRHFVKPVDHAALLKLLAQSPRDQATQWPDP